MVDSFAFWQLGESLRGLSSEDQNWTLAASKLATFEQTRGKSDRINSLEPKTSYAEVKHRGGKSNGKLEEVNDNQFNLIWKPAEAGTKVGIVHGGYNINHVINYNNNNTSSNGNNNYNNNSFEKRFKTLPSSEMLPRNEILGGYIFVCNNDTMQEDLKRQLFGLPQRYRDSVRAITLGPDGKTVQTSGVDLIREYKIRAYPFTKERLDEARVKVDVEDEAKRKAQTLKSLLVFDERNFVIRHGGAQVAVAELVGKTTGLYLSSHSPGPCTNFTHPS